MMSQSETLLYALFDSLVVFLIVPVRSEVALPAIQVFGNDDMYLVVGCALVGICLASVGNWFLGRMLTTAIKKNDQLLNGQGNRLVSIISNHYLIVLTAFVWVPVLGSALTIFSGFLKKSLIKTVFLTFFVYGCKYFVIYI